MRARSGQRGNSYTRKRFELSIEFINHSGAQTFVTGDIHYNIPKMNPLKMAHAVVKYDTDLKFILYDLEISGIETATLSKAT